MNKSTLYYRDGRKEEMEPKLAYALWLATLGTVLRTHTDKRPVMPWEYSTPRPK